MAETGGPPKARRRGLRKGMIILIIILGLLGAGVWWWFSPDLPPGGPIKALANGIGSLFSGEPKDVKLSPQELQAIKNDLKDFMPQPSPMEQKATNIATQLRTAGIPVSGVYVLETDSGKPVLGVGLDFDELLKRFGTEQSLNQVLASLQTFARNKSIDLSGMHDLDIVLHDSQDRVLLSISAPAATIQQFRNGQITEEAMLASIGARGFSRAGILDAARKAGLGR
ncbi:MAG: hypothetical protein HY529_03495 [Chloroflexi bacterium]|nr:hypothetical protein [Chloroflexota bacterium]